MRIRKLIFFLLIPLLSFQIFSQKGEVKTVEALPTRERAEMNIEVTKIKSEKIQGLLNRDEKTITLDLPETVEGYEFFFTENLNSLPSYSGNRVRMGTRETGKYNYKIDGAQGKKKMKIN
ncbi:MAG: hypothetical protein ACRCR2_04710, partial [Fusobacteriaceae bacterium]